MRHLLCFFIVADHDVGDAQVCQRHGADIEQRCAVSLRGLQARVDDEVALALAMVMAMAAVNRPSG
jgi:hypothetical protein